MSSTSGLTHLFDLARGGLGTVSLAVRREGSFSRVYAVKRLHAHLRDDEAFARMFVEEARIAGRLRHANIAGVLDVGVDEAGPFFVMEYVEGLSLRELLVDTAGLLPLQVVLSVAAQAARGLHAAHEATSETGDSLRLVHRDVSPHNLLLGYDGVVRVADFGIAKVRDSDQRTSTGILKGKMGYMSPEQLRFERVDARSDLFSLGVTIFEALSGERLYSSPRDALPGDEASAPYRILNEDPPELANVRRDTPPALEELMLELLAKQPAERPGSAEEVADRFAAILHEASVEHGPLTLAAYLGDHFEERRAQASARVQAAQQAVQEPEAPSIPHIPSIPASEAALQRRRARKSLPLAIGGLVLAAVGGSAIAVVEREAARELDSIESPADAPSPAPIPEPVLIVPAQVEGREEEEDEEPDEELSAAEEAPDERPVMRRVRRPRAMRAMRPAATPASMSDRPPDGWWTD
ncbi:MAG: serine/threonine-protein kinase [Myxococcota bacterium]